MSLWYLDSTLDVFLRFSWTPPPPYKSVLSLLLCLTHEMWFYILLWLLCRAGIYSEANEFLNIALAYSMNPLHMIFILLCVLLGIWNGSFTLFDTVTVTGNSSLLLFQSYKYSVINFKVATSVINIQRHEFEPWVDKSFIK